MKILPIHRLAEYYTGTFHSKSVIWTGNVARMVQTALQFRSVTPRGDPGRLEVTLQDNAAHLGVGGWYELLPGHQLSWGFMASPGSSRQMPG